ESPYGADTPSVFFDDSSGSLLSGGDTGLLRWPFMGGGPDGNRLRLGPPRHLSPMKKFRFARSADGHTLAVATEGVGMGDRILDVQTGAVGRDLGAHGDAEVCSLSPDGRWAASSGWHADRVRLLNAATGQVVHEWVVGPRTYVFFTPDSRALIISRQDEF